VTLPELDVARVLRFVDSENEKIPPAVRAEVRIEMDVGSTAITIFECRPLRPDERASEWLRQEVARLQYTSRTRTWSLYWPDRNSKFHRYDRISPSPRVGVLIDEISADPTGIFWG
jgi:hypothetical protein